ncbi:MAG TPA: hypothetical protein VK963_02020 [Candidatus Saccharimonadales bacterium]|nr:hypothetical protein [Candidatus Saccharimonadales bacterium]
MKTAAAYIPRAISSVCTNLSTAICLVATAAVLSPLPTAAASPSQLIKEKACQGSSNAIGCPGGTAIFGPGGVFDKAIGTFIFIIGGVSVLMIVVGGFRYVVSGGDPAGTRGAKDTILYAMVGLVISLFAYAAVKFVLTNIG